MQILHGDGTGQFTARVAAMPTGPRPLFVQFETGVQVGGQTRYAIGTADGLSSIWRNARVGGPGWGWRDERWGDTRTASPVLLRFPPGGCTRVRVQTREDGVLFDQIVLSSEQYLNAPPGPAKRDATILPSKPW